MDTNLFANNTDYLFTSSFDSNITGGNLTYNKETKTHINENSFKSAKNNSFETLRHINSKSKEQILYNEKTFLKAWANNDISSYWLYIENLFWNTKHVKVDEQQKKFVKILLKELQGFKNGFLRSLADLLTTHIFIPKYLGITYEERKHIFSEVYVNNNMEFDISFYKEKVKNNFFDEMIVYYKNFDANKQKEKWKFHLESLLLELYEYRNAELHSGRVNEYSKIKLTALLPGIINKVRWILINASKNYLNYSFEELIDLLSK